VTQAPRRIVVVGVSGAGKTSLATRIGARLGIPHADMDGFFHGPAWARRPEAAADVAAFVAGDAWVTERPYAEVSEVVYARAQLVVWLDLPTWRSMWQVIRRTVSRRLGRTVLWNGNVEGPLWRVVTDREHVVRWAWSTRHRYRDWPGALHDEWPALPVVRLRSHAEADAWLDTLQ
jgi:adenylate kinase family enzyme